jgi:hypothetical protein
MLALFSDTRGDLVAEADECGHNHNPSRNPRRRYTVRTQRNHQPSLRNPLSPVFPRCRWACCCCLCCALRGVDGCAGLVVVALLCLGLRSLEEDTQFAPSATINRVSEIPSVLYFPAPPRTVPIGAVVAVLGVGFMLVLFSDTRGDLVAEADECGNVSRQDTQFAPSATINRVSEIPSVLYFPAPPRTVPTQE